MALGHLHVVTDTRGGRDPLAVVGAALHAGAPVIQVRAKELSDRALYELSARVAERCARHDATCIVNDRPDIALAVAAGGAHVGADDLPVAAARAVLGPSLALGATARDVSGARAAERDGASYLGVGPVARTVTKGGLPAPLGLDGIARVTAAVSLPVIAVGGVSAASVPDLLAAGAYGVAVVSAVSEAGDPAAATEQLLAAIEAAVHA